MKSYGSTIIMGFTVKNHEARVVPLPTDLVEMLEAWYESRPPTIAGSSSAAIENRRGIFCVS